MRRNHQGRQNGKMQNAQSVWSSLTMLFSCSVPHTIRAVVLICALPATVTLNCFDQYTKATTNKTSRSWQMSSDTELYGMSCPLCRGQVKGWTVVEPARSYLNAKKRPCVQEGCSFVGRYKELRKHVRSKHPLARPRDIDPLHAKKWQKLENERDLSDVLSTIRSSMPGAIVIGDYMIDYGQVVERRNPPQQRVG